MPGPSESVIGVSYICFREGPKLPPPACYHPHPLSELQWCFCLVMYVYRCVFVCEFVCVHECMFDTRRGPLFLLPQGPQALQSDQSSLASLKESSYQPLGVPLWVARTTGHGSWSLRSAWDIKADKQEGAVMASKSTKGFYFRCDFLVLEGCSGRIFQ